MKRIIMVILVSIGISSSVYGQTFTKEEIKQTKDMIEQMYKSMFTGKVKKSEQEIDCLCKVIAGVSVDIIIEKAKQKTLDMSFIMEMFAELQNPDSPLYNEYTSRCDTELKKKCGFLLASVTVDESVSTNSQQTLTKENTQELKVMLEQMCKAMSYEGEADNVEKNADCVCKVTAEVSIDFITERYKDKPMDISEFMRFFTELQDPNSPLYNEYMSKLQTELEKKCKILSSSITLSGPSTGTIPLLKSGKMYKIKVRLGTSDKYYLMDSGASMSCISRSYARELEKLGILTKKNYIREAYFETASGAFMLCSVYLLNNVKIGDFTLNDVEFSVFDEDIEFLFGKNILDAFSSWQVKNNTTILELVK
jgi:hypothetical protein